MLLLSQGWVQIIEYCICVKSLPELSLNPCISLFVCVNALFNSAFTIYPQSIWLFKVLQRIFIFAVSQVIGPGALNSIHNNFQVTKTLWNLHRLFLFINFLSHQLLSLPAAPPFAHTLYQSSSPSLYPDKLVISSPAALHSTLYTLFGIGDFRLGTAGPVVLLWHPVWGSFCNVLAYIYYWGVYP